MFEWNKSFMEMFLQKQLHNEENLFLSRWSFTIKEVKNWALVMKYLPRYFGN